MSFFKIRPELKSLSLKNPLHCLALGFGAGLSPRAPGTMGTLVAIPLYLLVSGLPTPWFIALLAVGFVAGIRICQAATDAIGMPDHGAIVWDEVIGFGVTMIAAPAGWEWVLAGFVLFRLFDVLKPWPISWFAGKAGRRSRPSWQAWPSLPRSFIVCLPTLSIQLSFRRSSLMGLRLFVCNPPALSGDGALGSGRSF